MSEALITLDAALNEQSVRRPSVLCAVVEASGSTPQVPGALMLVREGETALGTVGGGRLEGETLLRAQALLSEGGSALLRFTLDDEAEKEGGAICGGRMAIGLRCLDDTDTPAIQEACSALRAGAAAELSLEVEGRALTIPLAPAPRLLVAGAGHVGMAVAKLAAEVGFSVTVYDDRAELLDSPRVPPGVTAKVGDIAQALGIAEIDGATYVVLVTRNHAQDRAALEAILDRPARYVGMIGSRRKVALMFDAMRQAGTSPDALRRVHTPIGLPIGAVTVPEIAVSIVAQLIAVRRE